ncbi:MAG: PHP domain-containing protein [Deltaproteobacteria bacterium]|nr:PHP domain-containing protein [Deltaproteobacteria bacterium]
MSSAPYPVDLHAHTLVSDGLRTPAELVELAAGRGVLTLALTDHDAVEGIAPARDAAARHGLELVPGVELSCDLDAREVHLLGLGIDPDAPALRELLTRAQASRRKAFLRALERLATCRVPLPEDLVERLDAQGTRALGRAHLGRALTRAGHTRSVGEAFARFLGEGAPARVIRERPSLEEAIEVVVAAGGLPLLAHPGGYAGSTFGVERLRQLKRLGVVGLELRHPAHKSQKIRAFREAALELSLLVSGGSDHHGYPGDQPPGSQGLDLEEYRPLAARLASTG